MTLAEFLTSPDAWLGQQVEVEEAWLHSDGFERVCLTDSNRFERELVTVDAPWAAKWVNHHIPPRGGAPSAYYFEASVRGTVMPCVDGVPVLGGELYIIIRHSGQLHLRSDTDS